MSNEERIGWAISSLIVYFQAHDHAKGAALAKSARNIFARELQVASASIAGLPEALGHESARSLH